MGFYLCTEAYCPADYQRQYGCPWCGESISPCDPSRRIDKWYHTDLVVDCHLSEMDSPICLIKFLVAYNDGTWVSRVVEVPHALYHDDCADEDRNQWFNVVHGDKFGNVTLIAVQELDPQRIEPEL